MVITFNKSLNQEFQIVLTLVKKGLFLSVSVYMSFSVNTSVFRYNAECYLVFQSLKHTDSFSLHSPGQSYFPKMDLILPFPHWKIFIDFQSPTAVFLKYIWMQKFLFITFNTLYLFFFCSVLSFWPTFKYCVPKFLYHS